MRVFAEVKFLASSKQSFTSQQGEYVEYFENAVKGDGGIITLNSKADYTECEGKTGVIEIELTEREDGKGFKAVLKKFTEGETIESADDDIE